MGSFDFTFKSVGRTSQQRKDAELVTTAMPIGLKTPVRANPNGGIFDVHYVMADQVADNLRNLLLTNWGERLTLYNYGANLRPILSDFVSQDDFDSQAVERISSAVSRWMPYVSLENYLSETDFSENNNGLSAVRLTITYSVPALAVVKRALQLILYVM